MQRARFLTASGAAGLVAAVAPIATSADGARSGGYCLPLKKGSSDLSFDFQLETLDSDDVFSLQDHQGHPVWVNFFASWCAPCNEEMPDVVRLAAAYAEKGLRTFGIDIQEPEAKVRAFRTRYDIAFPLLLDRKSSVFHAFGLHGIPSHVFFAPNGTITCIAEDKLEPRQMDNEIAVALARSPVKPTDRTTPSPV